LLKTGYTDERENVSIWLFGTNLLKNWKIE
jgi:hypothetical protein